MRSDSVAGKLQEKKEKEQISTDMSRTSSSAQLGRSSVICWSHTGSRLEGQIDTTKKAKEQQQS
jgi:hypothetical protein